MSGQANIAALPGFEEFMGSDVDRAGAKDLTAAKYTATTVLKLYPGTFKAAATALFKYNLPTRLIRELFQMNGNTVRGIRDLVMAATSKGGAASFLMKCRAASSKSLIVNRLLDRIQDKLDDDLLMNSVTVNELIQMAEKVDKLAVGQSGEGESSKNVTIVEPDDANDFESVVNGLISEKNRAQLPDAREDVEEVANEVETAENETAKVTRGTAITAQKSTQLSEGVAENKGCNDSLSKRLSEVEKNSSIQSSAAKVRLDEVKESDQAENDPLEGDDILAFIQGGGGTPGASRAGV